MPRIKKITPEVYQAFRDPRNFFKFLKVFDKESNKLVPFQLRPQQEELLEALLTHNKIVVLKARQLGVSTLLRAYFLWKTYMSVEPTQHAIISYTRDSADHLHNMDKGFYLSLPKPLQRKLSKSSSRTLQFGDTNAGLRAFTAGGKAGATRSFTFTDTHISEFAFFDDQDDLLANVMASVGEGQIVIETTPNTPGDKYHDLIMGAPENDWHLCWFPWYEHPQYTKKSQFHQPQVPDPTEEEIQLKEDFDLTLSQLYWRRTMIKTMGLEKFRREFPATVDEAFFASSNEFFPADVLDELEVLDCGGQKDRWYCEPVPGDKFAMGVDVSGGRGGDYSVITVVSCTTMQPVYHFRSNQILPHILADKVYELYWEFNEPYTIVEQNGPGETVLYRLKEWKVKNLYKDAKGRDWRTRKENKIAIFDYLRDLICEGVIDAVERDLWAELRAVQITQGAPKVINGHDDLVVATALALWAAKLKPVPSFFQVRQSMIDDMIKSRRAASIKRNNGIHKNIRGWNK
jgi:hypothetical protein